ncbi:MAG TPA: phosphopantothenoylcysteine decarboxylase, partial [Candidatus Bathyarchaeia archaeon]|nr:phosphopantothenoylcysteine decarboxylase [Candidatus Bathyarchaeia archaeon]
RVQKFTFFDEFAKLFTAELKKHPDVIIHAAAVSDFRPRQKYPGKLSSDKPLKLVLVPTEKLIGRVKRLAPKTVLVGFKLETTGCARHLRKAALDSIAENRCDLIVANSLTKGYRGFIFNQEGALVAQATTREAMSRQLIAQLKRYDACPV